MSKIISLCKNYEFKRLYKKGDCCVLPTMVVYVGRGRKDEVRLGITVSKKLGGAVVRNRAKRRIRELFVSFLPDIKSGLDICVVARSRINTAEFLSLVNDFKKALHNLDAFADELK